MGEEAGERFQDILEAKPGPRPTQANDTDERGPSEVESGSPSMSSQSDDEEKPMKKIPYPKAIPFILSTEFCERFSFYGMRTVLSLYFIQILRFSEDDATVLFHAFNILCYVSPLFGAMLADSFFGKFNTIFYVTILYALGQVVLTVGSIGDEIIPGMPTLAVSFIGLAMIGVGTGGIKPCVATFGGEHFKLPEQTSQLMFFFSIFYGAINAGSLISTLLTPILRQNVSCFGEETCFPAAFGVPAVLMFAALFFFGTGRLLKLYVNSKPAENIIIKTSKCFWYAFKEKRKRSKTEKLPEMLDYAKDKYGKSFVSDCKAFKNVIYMFLPFPVFWSLYEQQGSRWLFQTTRMNGNFFGYQILPDQMQVLNPILILAFIPLFDYVIYPLLAKVNLCKTSLQRLVGGGLLGAVAFVVSAGLEFKLEKTYPILPEPGQMQMTFYNGLYNNAQLGCSMGPFKGRDTDGKEFQVDFGSFDENLLYVDMFLKKGKFEIEGKVVKCGDKNQIEFKKLTFEGPPPEGLGDEGVKIKEDDSQGLSFTVDFAEESLGGKMVPSKFREKLSKSDNGLPYVKIFYNMWSNSHEKLRIRLTPKDNPQKASVFEISGKSQSDTNPTKVKAIGEYMITLETSDGQQTLMSRDEDLKVGANYQIYLEYNDAKPQLGFKNIQVQQITAENSIHMFWQLPQILVMTAAEIMFSITIIHFAFSQAPETMKAVMMSMTSMTDAGGNLITMALTAALKGVFSSQAYEFLLFAGLLVLDMILLAWMASRYTYVDYTTGEGVIREDDEDDLEPIDEKEAAEILQRKRSRAMSNPAFEDYNKL